MTDTKVCTKCKVEKPIEDFYKHKTGIHCRCKTCYKTLQNERYQHKPTGFQSLDKEVQADVIRKLRDRSFKMKTIAKEAGIAFNTLARWMKEKQINTQ